MDHVEQTPDLVRLHAHPHATSAECPACGCTSARVHSRYQRRLADTALGDRRTVIDLHVRRFFCDVPGCRKRTFAEQITDLTTPHARRTPVLRGKLEKIAIALAGRPGARLARLLGLLIGRSTMLRLLMALPDPPAPTPRVLGVDDFALLRGHIYGTILINCETGAPIELLDGREAEPLASWLRDHPGVEVICRDRSGAYAEAARTGAPTATQVADRFHLWQNLTKAVERCVAEHRSCLRETAGAVDGPPDTPVDEETADPASEEEESEPLGRFAERTRIRHALVHELLGQGHSLRGIAARLGWGRHTVQRYARAATWEEMVDGKWQQPRSSKLDAFKPYLHQRVEEGCTNAAQLYREITERGFRGSYSIVRDYLGPSRTEAASAPAPPLTVRQVTGWLTRHPATLDEDEKLKLKAILEHCSELRTTADQVRRFGEMLTELRGQELPAWIASVQEEGLSGLRGFVSGVKADFDAVQQGLTSDHNSGAVEGRVNHIKTVKRQMYGRAGLPLLRKRVLLTASR